MESLFISLQLDNQFKRQIAMLRYLGDMTQPISSKLLTKELDLSAPTLRHEIAVLNNCIEGHELIHSPRVGEYLIRFPDGMSVDSIISRLAKETTVFRIVNTILHRRMWTVSQAAFDLGISTSTLIRFIRHINQILKPYRISISARDADFVGDEKDIRTFLFLFYSSLREPTIIDRNIEQEVGEVLSTLEQTSSIPIVFNHFRWSLWLSILKVRWSQECYLQVPQTAKFLIQTAPAFPGFRSALDGHFASYKLSEDEIIWCYALSFYCTIYSKENPSYAQDEQNFRYFTVPYNIKEQMDIMVMELLAPYEQKDIGKSIFSAYLLNTYLLSLITPNFQIIEGDFRTYIKGSHEETYQRFYEILSAQGADEHAFEFEHVEDVACSLTTILHGIMKCETAPPIRIIFALQGSPGLDEYIVERSRAVFHENAVISYLYERPINDSHIIKEKPDMVISNYDVSLTADHDCSIVRLSNIPTLREWEMIRSESSRIHISMKQRNA